MMKKAGVLLAIFLLFSGFLILPGVSAAQQLSELDPKAAEELYRQGDYPAAISIYQQIIGQGLTNGEIYYNLGNCYYKLGQYGRAILNYQRAHPFLGNDPDLQVNLKLANLRIYDRIEPLPRFFIIRILEGAAGFLSTRRWAFLFLLAEWVLLACLIALHLIRKPRWRRLFVGSFVSVGLVFILSGGFFLQQMIQEGRLVQGIVLAEKVEVRSAPESGSTELFALHEGVKVRVLRQVSGWAEIRLADGKQGWMPQSAFEII